MVLKRLYRLEKDFTGFDDFLNIVYLYNILFGEFLF